LIAPSRYYGQHGYLATHNAVSGVFFARGADVEVGSSDEIHVTDVAPLVATWLGIELQ
jgi:hypothetical protein